jgi:hypothetical protein
LNVFGFTSTAGINAVTGVPNGVPASELPGVVIVNGVCNDCTVVSGEGVCIMNYT